MDIERRNNPIPGTNYHAFAGYRFSWCCWCSKEKKEEIIIASNGFLNKKYKIRAILFTMDITHDLTFLDKIRHQLNPMHLYCRLTCLGISSKIAREICKIYEAGFYKPTLGR
jgi:hypothetical protein